MYKQGYVYLCGNLKSKNKKQKKNKKKNKSAIYALVGFE
jgi:hypothetical protein